MEYSANFIVLYDESHLDFFEKNIKPNLEQSWTVQAFTSIEALSFSQQDVVVAWLSDEMLYDLIPLAIHQEWTLGFLPHPEMNRFYRTFSLPKKVEEAVEDIKTCESPVEADILFCNDDLVLSSVMLGNEMLMNSTANIDDSIWGRLRSLASLSINLSKVSLSAINLTTEKGTAVNTAALGLSFVYRPSASDFTKHLIKQPGLDSPTVNALIVAPRSMVEIVKFLASRLFLRQASEPGLVSYIGHIKAKSIEVVSDNSIDYTIDGQHKSAENLHLTVKESALKICSQLLPEQEKTEEPKESIRVKSLPKGQAVKELVSRSLPWIHHVDYDEVKSTFVNLKESAQTSESFLVLMVLSTLLATVGLFANSAPVIIGAMILAPLMAPIISLSMGVLRQDVDLIGTASKTLTIGVLLALFFGVLLTLITPLQAVTNEISARLHPTILDMGVAIIAGVAAAYASARSEVAKSLAGVAIAVALVPPLAVSGIGIGWLDWHVFSAAFLLFFTNLVGIVLASTLTFLLLGFSPFHLAKKGLVVAFGFVLIVSVPLSLSFAKLVEKQQMISALEGLTVNQIELRDVQIKQQSPLYISVTLLSNQNIGMLQRDKIKQAIEARLDRDVKLESKVAYLHK